MIARKYIFDEYRWLFDVTTMWQRQQLCLCKNGSFFIHHKFTTVKLPLMSLSLDMTRSKRDDTSVMFLNLYFF